MMLYDIIDGAFLGFYREYGGTVFISGYRTIVKKKWIVRMRLEEVLIKGEWTTTELWIEEHEVYRSFWVPGHEQTGTRIVPGHWLVNEVWVEGHYEERRFWVEENCWYESKTILRNILGVMVPVTRMVEVCEPAHWATWDYWVSGDWIEVKEWVPEVEVTKTVWIPGHDEVRLVTIPLHSIQFPVQRPDRIEFMEIESGAWEDVEVEDPIYSYYGLRDEYCLVKRKRGPVYQISGEHEGDTLGCRITGTDEWVTFNADYMFCATRISENQFVDPG